MEKKLSLPVVKSFHHLISDAKKANAKLAPECYRDILFAAIKRLGPERTEKNIARCKYSVSKCILLCMVSCK